MLVSIVIPAYNARLFLAETVASVKSQTFQDWELVIIDDGSKDDTYRLACRFAEHDARIRVVQQANAGTSAARNTGLAYRLHPFNESKKYKNMRSHEMACTLKAYTFTGNTPDQRRMIEIGCRAIHMRYSRSKFQIASGDLRKGRLDRAVRQCIYGINHIIKSRKKLK
jgi:glycosyltransferase involved in cell wall biosynthesis